MNISIFVIIPLLFSEKGRVLAEEGYFSFSENNRFGRNIVEKPISTEQYKKNKDEEDKKKNINDNCKNENFITLTKEFNKEVVKEVELNHWAASQAEEVCKILISFIYFGLGLVSVSVSVLLSSVLLFIYFYLFSIYLYLFYFISFILLFFCCFIYYFSCKYYHFLKSKF